MARFEDSEVRNVRNVVVASPGRRERERILRTIVVDGDKNSPARVAPRTTPENFSPV